MAHLGLSFGVVPLRGFVLFLYLLSCRHPFEYPYCPNKLVDLACTFSVQEAYSQF